jgi:GTPase
MEQFNSVYIALVGRPNVGKSTLLNTLLKQKVAAVSPRPQTTRRRQLGILTTPDSQIVFVDTPGIHNPHHKLGEFMNEEAITILQDMDCVVWLVDASVDPDEEDILVASRLQAIPRLPTVLLALNKTDLFPSADLEARKATYHSLLPQAEPYPISASLGTGCLDLLNRMISILPEGEPFFDEDQVTDLYERDIAADLIRETALLNLREEVPHAIAVRVDEYTERSETNAFIAATIFVEKESQKGIVIGHGGEMLKKIGSAARREIETMSGRKIFLELRVKVDKNWRNNLDTLRLLGYAAHDKE